jgi:pilus assembly protein CpaC
VADQSSENKGCVVLDRCYPGKFGLLIMLALIVWAQSIAAQPMTLDMHVGAVRILEVGEVQRVAVGKDELLGTSVLSGGRVLLIGRDTGSTDIRISFADGTERQWIVNIAPRDMGVVVATLGPLLQDYPGLQARAVGMIAVVEGHVPASRISAVKDLINQIPGVVPMITASETSIETLVKTFPRVRARVENGIIVLEGEVHESDFELYNQALQKFPDSISLVRKTTVAPAPMIRVALRLVEINREHSRRVGINWDDSFAGPSVGSTGASITNSRFRIVPPGHDALVQNIGISDARWFAYAGWTTQVFSAVEMLEQENQATILAEPNLTTRSGMAANFLAGGELPYIVIGDFGQPDVEFKEYGVRLDIEPTVDQSGNIETKIKIDVSSIDRANAVNNIPGLLKRTTESVMTVKSGQTMILSGLVTADDTRNMNGVPGLAKVPVLGYLFKSRNFQSRKSELVVMVTPTIVDAPQEEGPLFLDELERMRHLLDDKILEGAIAE